MSTILLYHGFGIIGYCYIRSEYREGDVIFTVARKKFSLRCPVCKSKRIIKHGALPRWFHSLPIGNKPTYIKTKIARVECKDCKTNHQVDIGFADPRLTYTKALGRYVLDLARHMTIVDVSRHLALSWDIIKSNNIPNLTKIDGSAIERQFAESENRKGSEVGHNCGHNRDLLGCQSDVIN